VPLTVNQSWQFFCQSQFKLWVTQSKHFYARQQVLL